MHKLVIMFFSLTTKRLPVMSKYLTVEQNVAILKRPFQSPVPGAPAMSNVNINAFIQCLKLPVVAQVCKLLPI